MSLFQKISNYFFYESNFLDFSFLNIMIKSSENTNEAICVLESSTSEISKIPPSEDPLIGLSFFIVPIILCLVSQNSSQINDSFNFFYDRFFGGDGGGGSGSSGSSEQSETSDVLSSSVSTSDSSSTVSSTAVEIVENLSNSVETVVSQPVVLDTLPLFGKVYKIIPVREVPSWLENWNFDYSSMLNILNLIRDESWLHLEVNSNLITSFTYYQLVQWFQSGLPRCKEVVYEFFQLVDLKIKNETSTGSLEAIEQYINMNFMELYSDNGTQFLAVFDLIWGERSGKLLLFFINAMYQPVV